MSKTVTATNNIIKCGGVWTSASEIDSKMEKYKNKGWVKAQLRDPL